MLRIARGYFCQVVAWGFPTWIHTRYPHDHLAVCHYCYGVDCNGTWIPFWTYAEAATYAKKHYIPPCDNLEDALEG